MSDMKCPFCGEKIEHIEDGWCNCKNRCTGSGSIELWLQFLRTRKALDVAKSALKEQQRWLGVIRVSLISHLNNEYGTAFKSYDADPTVVNVKRANDILNTAINEITALEQKDIK